MPKKCNYPKCQNNVFSRNFCKNHQKYCQPKKVREKKDRGLYVRPVEEIVPVSHVPVFTAHKTPKKPIAKHSKPRKEQEKEYAIKRKQYLAEHQKCEGGELCKNTNCKGTATDIHHTKGRIGNLLNDTRYWKALSRPCHLWVESHPIQAKEMLLSVSRLKK